MKTQSKQIAHKVKSPKVARVPVPLTAKEEKQLAALAETEHRSKQSMAGIIYRLGMNAYVNNPGSVNTV